MLATLWLRQESLELIYTSNAVVHILSGKAIARAVRGHFLVDAALNAIILYSVFNVPIGGLDMKNEDEMVTSSSLALEESVGNTNLGEAAVQYKKLMDGSLSANEVCQDNALLKTDVALRSLSEPQKCGYSTFENVSERNVQATGNCILIYLQRMSHLQEGSSRCVQALQRWSEKK